MSKFNSEYYKKYCTGCGLCQSCDVAELELNKNGFYEPQPKDESVFNEFCSNNCVSSGKHSFDLSCDSIWGRTKGYFLAWSADEDIRHTASSGGVITSLCVYLLENHMVDGIIHIGVKKGSAIETTTYLSTTKEEIMSRSGSRYCISSVLLDLDRYLQSDKTYVLVGRPCDIGVLRNYAKEDKRVDERIKYMLSFFCAGAPSLDVNKKLLKTMGTSEEKCQSLKYRGNGWPGVATAEDKDGKEHKMSYEESWGRILGRDVYPMCRFCIDGIGELADIACGDAWYLTPDGKPDFTEAKGRNAVLCRTEKGYELYKKACAGGYIVSEKIDDFEDKLPLMQKYQFERRATMGSMTRAMTLLANPAPKYDKKILKFYAKKVGFKIKAKRFIGIVKRSIKKKMK